MSLGDYIRSQETPKSASVRALLEVSVSDRHLATKTDVLRALSAIMLLLDDIYEADGRDFALCCVEAAYLVLEEPSEYDPEVLLEHLVGLERGIRRIKGDFYD